MATDDIPLEKSGPSEEETARWRDLVDGTAATVRKAAQSLPPGAQMAVLFHAGDEVTVK